MTAFCMVDGKCMGCAEGVRADLACIGENAGRNVEIKVWLDRKRYVDGYAILDDKDFGWSADLRAHFIRTDQCGDGLEEIQVQQAIDVLKGKLLPVPVPQERLRKKLDQFLALFRKKTMIDT